jgi:hypothetical protein
VPAWRNKSGLIAGLETSRNNREILAFDETVDA